MNSTRKRRKALIDPTVCVGCGCCIAVCPMQAIKIMRGYWAQVEQEKCIGCGKCAIECPASVIVIREVEGE